MSEEENTQRAMDPTELWKQWYETSSNQWLEMMEEARAKMLAGESLPADPFTFFKQWYEATSETWSKVVGDVIGTEKFVEATSRFLESYTSFARTLRRTNEEYFRNLQLPTRSDIARVAELVVALEEKVDRIEDAFEEFQEGPQVAISEVVEGLAKRLDRVESKLDKVLAALEKNAAKASRSTSATPRKTQEKKRRAT